MSSGLNADNAGKIDSFDEADKVTGDKPGVSGADTLPGVYVRLICWKRSASSSRIIFCQW